MLMYVSFLKIFSFVTLGWVYISTWLKSCVGGSLQ